MGKKKPSQKTAQNRQRKLKNDKAGANQRTLELKQRQEKFRKDFIEKINAERQVELDKRKQEVLNTQEVIEGADVGDIGEFVLDDVTPVSNFLEQTNETPVSNEELQEFRLD